MTFLLIGTNKRDLHLLRGGVRLLCVAAPRENGRYCDITIEEMLIHPQAGDTRYWYEELSSVLQRLLDRGDLTILVSEIRPHLLDPLVELGMESVIAMLVLTFPEVRWMFGTVIGFDGAPNSKKQELEAFRSAYGIANLFSPEQSVLFDGGGLRDWVRWRSSEEEESKGTAHYLPRRKADQTAVSVDDEISYSYLHSYTAYRFGFRAIALDSSALADHLLGNKSSFHPDLVFEDIYVNFVDGKPGMSWLGVDSENGAGRSKQWPKLEQAAHRIFVTSGQRLRGDETKWEHNACYIAQQKAKSTDDGQPRHICTLHKPYAGMFQLWQESGLAQGLRWQDGTGQTHRGIARGFCWPPLKESVFSSEHGHSSPGVLLSIAERLLERAKRLQSNIHSVQDAVRGSVFATDALELLGGRTPTVSIESLQLKHHFEVVAECQFTGVEHHIRLKERFLEIERDVGMISHWFGIRQQKLAALNAELTILTDLVRIFRDTAKFDEEQASLRRVRKLHRRIWFQRRKPWSAVMYPFRWYAEFLLGSIPRFVGAIVFWLMILTVLFVITSDATVSVALKAAFISFVAIQPANDDPNFAVTALAMLSGVTHLGIFISHLYSLVARK